MSQPGWPLGLSDWISCFLTGVARAALTEILCDGTGMGELCLLATGLARLSWEDARWIAWINPPFLPYASALANAGVAVDKVLQQAFFVAVRLSPTVISTTVPASRFGSLGC